MLFKGSFVFIPNFVYTSEGEYENAESLVEKTQICKGIVEILWLNDIFIYLYI